MKKLPEKVYTTFKDIFNAHPLIIRAPGRINLIGEHTDYNNGFVLPAAIDKSIVLAMAPNTLAKIRLYALDMSPSRIEIDLTDPIPKSNTHWANYILGVVDQLNRRKLKTDGFDCVFGGDIPIGAGLSSSAALECGTVFGLSNMFGLDLSRYEMAHIAQRAENEFVGMQCGIMDQFASLYGKAHQAIQLDCKYLEYELYPFHRNGLRIVLFDSKVHRELTTSEYNIRREQCNAGVRVLRKHAPYIRSLRDVTMTLLEKHRKEFDPVVYNRCLFVLAENRRVTAACKDLTRNDMVSFGKRMYESHYGLRDLYEVSCKELDILVDATEGIDAVLGSRMMGGGFGGCTINLISDEEVRSVIATVKRVYKKKTGITAEVYSASIGDGTEVLPYGD
jgi:galactokinase